MACAVNSRHVEVNTLQVMHLLLQFLSLVKAGLVTLNLCKKLFLISQVSLQRIGDLHQHITSTFQDMAYSQVHTILSSHFWGSLLTAI